MRATGSAAIRELDHLAQAAAALERRHELFGFAFFSEALGRVEA